MRISIHKNSCLHKNKKMNLNTNNSGLRPVTRRLGFSALFQAPELECGEGDLPTHPRLHPLGPNWLNLP